MTLDTDIRRRIKNQRQQAGLSLRELARRTDLTASFLSQIERGQANPSIESLQRIAAALEISILDILSESTGEAPPPTVPDATKPALPTYNPIVRAAGRPKLILPDTGVSYELLTPDLAHKMEVIHGYLKPGVDNVARPLREPTEEFIYVLSGSLLVGLEHNEYVLNPGDAIYFEGTTLRRLACASEEPVSWISVITPPVF